MAHYRQVGPVPGKRHTLFKDTDGRILSEELMGEEGFSSDSSLLYHRHIPSGIVDARPWELPDQTLVPNEPLLPRHLRLHDLFADEAVATTDAVTGRRLVLGNTDVRLSYAHVGATSPLYKNAIGDECVYVERGSALLETQFGALEATEGDYVVIPRATIHRWVLRTGETARLYAIEASSHIAPPRRYLSRYGQLLEHAPYCERDLHGPTEPLLVEEQDVDVHIKHRGRGPSGMSGTITRCRSTPSTSSAGTGASTRTPSTSATTCRSRARCTSRRRRTRSSRGRASSSATSSRARSTTTSSRCRCRTTTPTSTATRSCSTSTGTTRPARSGIGKGSISVHPGGHAHGPQPGAVEASLGADHFDETAVMVDTFRPLELGEAGIAVDDGVYARSWTGGRWLGGR